jgi:hypothetical protein
VRLYTAIVLVEGSHSRLVKYFDQLGLDFNTENLCHHVTINMGQLDKELNPEVNLGDVFDMFVTHFGFDDRVAAFKVDHTDSVVGGARGIKSMNKTPHITAGIKNGGKPFQSNQLDFWEPVAPWIPITGILRECR